MESSTILPCSAQGSQGGGESPQARPPSVCIRPQSSLSTLAHGLPGGRGDLTQASRWGPEQFLSLHPLFNYPENSAALSAPTRQLRFLPSSPLQAGKLLFPVTPTPLQSHLHVCVRQTHSRSTHRQAASCLNRTHSVDNPMLSNWRHTGAGPTQTPLPPPPERRHKGHHEFQDQTTSVERELHRTKTSLHPPNEPRQLWDNVQCPLA